MLKRLSLAAVVSCVMMGGALAADPVKVKIGHAGIGIFRLPLYVAIKGGFFKEEGIEPEVVDTRSGSDADMMLAGGAVDFVTAPLIDNINLNKQGIHAVGVVALFNRFNNSITIRKSLAGEIKKFEDMKGRPFGVTGIGSGTWQFALFMATVTKMSRDDLNLIAVGTGASMLGAVRAGRVDAMSYADPENNQLVEGGDALFLVDMTDEATHQKYAGNAALFSHMFTTEAVIKAKPQMVQSYVNAIQRSIVWLQGRAPEDVATLIGTYPGFDQVQRPLLIATVKRSQNAWPKTSVISREAYDGAMKLPVAIGAIEAAMPFERLVDNSFAEKAAAKYPSK